MYFADKSKMSASASKCRCNAKATARHSTTQLELNTQIRVYQAMTHWVHQLHRYRIGQSVRTYNIRGGGGKERMMMNKKKRRINKNEIKRNRSKKSTKRERERESERKSRVEERKESPECDGFDAAGRDSFRWMDWTQSSYRVKGWLSAQANERAAPGHW